MIVTKRCQVVPKELHGTNPRRQNKQLSPSLLRAFLSRQLLIDTDGGLPTFGGS